MVIGVMVSFINSPFTGNTLDFWKERATDILTFAKDQPYDIFGSILVYVGLALIGLTWTLGWMLFIVKERNFYDQLFLLFVCIPVIANIFALFAQLSLNTHKFTNAKLAKEEIEQEKTNIIRLFENKKKKLAKEIKLAQNEVVKVEAVQDSTPDIKIVATKTNVKKKGAKVVQKKATVVVEPKAKKTVAKKKAKAKKVVAKKVVKKAPAKKVVKKTTKKK